MKWTKEEIQHWYGKWLEVFKGYHLEEVPFAKILMDSGWFDAVGKGEKYVPAPRSREVPPQLILHTDGFYTVFDGRRRLFDMFKDSTSGFGRAWSWIHEPMVICLVRNKIESQPATGKFVWQIGNLNAHPYREIKTPLLIKIARWASGKSRFHILEGPLRRNLSISTQRILSEVEDVLATLYSDGMVRLYDLQQLVKLAEERGEEKQVLIEAQFKRLKKYQKALIRLTEKDTVLENKEIGLLEKLSGALESELQRSSFALKYAQKLRKLVRLLQHEETGLQQVLRWQLELSKEKKIPSIEKTDVFIKAEQEFLEEIIHWTHHKYDFE